jgi:hypothetical protein
MKSKQRVRICTRVSEKRGCDTNGQVWYWIYDATPMRRITLELPEELGDELARIAAAFEISDVNDAALIGLADWIARRKSELDDRDPAERYFVNEALDQLAARKRD